MHRLFHVPTISEGIVDHYSHGYAGILELAKKDPEKSGIDTDALQYFAIDVWAYDIAAPGVGCTGKPPAESASPSGTTSTTVPAATGTTSSAASVSLLLPRNLKQSLSTDCETSAIPTMMVSYTAREGDITRQDEASLMRDKRECDSRGNCLLLEPDSFILAARCADRLGAEARENIYIQKLERVINSR